MGYKIYFDRKSIVYHPVEYINTIKFIKLFRNHAYFPLLVKKNPEIRELLILRYIAYRNHIYPIFLFLFVLIYIVNMYYNVYYYNIISFFSFITAYLKARVFIDNNIYHYPLRILAFPRNLIIDSTSLYHFIKGSLQYRTLVI